MSRGHTSGTEVNSWRRLGSLSWKQIGISLASLTEFGNRDWLNPRIFACFLCWHFKSARGVPSQSGCAVINFDFPLQDHQENTSQYEELGFSSLTLRQTDDLLPILTTSLIHFSLKVWVCVSHFPKAGPSSTVVSSQITVDYSDENHSRHFFPVAESTDKVHTNHSKGCLSLTLLLAFLQRKRVKNSLLYCQKWPGILVRTAPQSNSTLWLVTDLKVWWLRVSRATPTWVLDYSGLLCSPA